MFYYNPVNFSFHLYVGENGCFASLNTQGDGFLVLFPHTLLPETPSRSHLDSCSLMLSTQMAACDTMPGPSGAGFSSFLAPCSLGQQNHASAPHILVVLFLRMVYYWNLQSSWLQHLPRHGGPPPRCSMRAPCTSSIYYLCLNPCNLIWHRSFAPSIPSQPHQVPLWCDSSNRLEKVFNAKHMEQPEPAPAFLSWFSPTTTWLLPIRVSPWGFNSCGKRHKLTVLSSALPGSWQLGYPEVPYLFGRTAGLGQAFCTQTGSMSLNTSLRPDSPSPWQPTPLTVNSSSLTINIS